MEEKIKIFELDIDVDAAISKTTELKKQSDGLKKNLNALKKSGDTSSESYVLLEAKLKSVNKEYTSARNQVTNLIQVQGKEIKTIEQGRTALKVISKEWAKQASLYGANSKQADKLAKKKLELTERLKELESATGDNTRSVGGYTEGLTAALNKSNGFTKAQSLLKDVLKVGKPVYQALKLELGDIATKYRVTIAGTKGLSRAQKASAITTNLVTAALRLMKIALIATGIGAIVVLIGSLVAWFSKTQAGIDFVNKALAGLQAAFSVIIDRLSKVGGALIKLFSGDFSGAFEDITEAASGLGDELAREVALAYQLEEALQRLRDKEIGLITTQAARKKQIAELRLLAKEEGTSLEERARLLQQAGDIEKQILADGLAVARERARISQAQLELGESTADEIRENAELQAKVIELETESLKRQKSIEAERQGLLKRASSERKKAAKEVQDRAKKAIDAAIKESKVRLQIFILENKEKAKTLEAGIKQEEDIRDKRLAILEEELKAGKKTQSEAELERLKIKNDFLENQKDLTISFAQEELEIFKDSNASRLEANQLLTDALVEQEITRLNALAEKEREFQDERLAQGEISQREYNAAINAINDENESLKLEKQNELKAQKNERDLIDFENDQAIRVERDGLIFEAQLEALERNRLAELEAAEKSGADTTKVDEKFSVLRKKIKQQELNAKLQAQQDLFGGVAELLGKETAAGKAASIAQSTINTFQGVTEVWRSKSVLPEPFATAQKVVNTGVVIGSGLKAVQKITSTDTSIPKAEQGALFEIGGKRHSAGGTKFMGEDGTTFEAEQGELIGVMNRRAAMAFKGFNDQFVTTSTSVKPNFFVDGGIVQRTFSTNSTSTPQTQQQALDVDTLAEKIADANRQLPPPVTDVKDIISQINNFNEIVDGANI